MKIKLDSKAIYLAMASKGLSGAELAEKAGVTQQAISNILCRGTVCHSKALPKVLEILELDIKDIAEIIN